MEKFSLSGKGGGVSYRYLSSSATQETLKPPHFGRIVTALLHNMSDASRTGYGQCSYPRLVDENVTIHCSLVLGKARVAPLRSLTIPRLELTAATVSVRVASVLKEELDYEEL